MVIELLLLTISLFIIGLTFFRSTRGDGNGGAHKKLPPGVIGGWPLIGETIAFMRPHSPDSLGAFIDQHITKYGKIFKMNLLGKRTIVSTDTEFNKFVLQNEGKLFQVSYSQSLKKILGRWSMLALPTDVMHKELRTFVVGFMGNNKLRTYFLKDLDVLAQKILDGWPKDGVMFATEECKKFGLHIMVKRLMNMEPGKPEAEEIRKACAHLMKGMTSLPLNLPGTYYRKALKCRAKIVKMMGQIIDERIQKIREECKSIEEVEEEEEEYDLIGVAAKHPNLTKDQILDLVLGLLLGGHESTPGLMSLVIYFLHHNSKALLHLREEHLNIWRQKEEKGDVGLSWDDYKQMKFMHSVINEALRLGNIVKIVHRRAVKDVKFKDFDIPCGWEVVPILSAAHFDESIYDEAQVFNPWRWTTESATKNNNLMAFSGGPRLCPGAELARLETAVFFHHLVRRFDWELAEDDSPVSTAFLSFPKGLPIRIKAL